ncbi:MAG: polysaccharide biosynthesis/export family protein [Chitinophagaceae bacterium]
MSLFLSSCVNQRKATYFNNLPDSTSIKLATLEVPQTKIQVNDILQIKVGGENEKTVQYINQYFGLNSGNASESNGGGGLQCMVGVNGDIDLPKIGKVKVVGLSRDEAKDTITVAYSEYLKDPIVTVNLSNFRFAVLGEVKNPGYYSLTNEKINLFEALAQAGDMTQYSRRDNVKIIRDNNGKREIISVNFNDKNILNSPYYYLNRFDIIYVESQNVKLFSENFSRTASIIATITSILAIIFVVLKK